MEIITGIEYSNKIKELSKDEDEIKTVLYASHDDVIKQIKDSLPNLSISLLYDQSRLSEYLNNCDNRTVIDIYDSIHPTNGFKFKRRFQKNAIVPHILFKSCEELILKTGSHLTLNTDKSTIYVRDKKPYVKEYKYLAKDLLNSLRLISLKMNTLMDLEFQIKNRYDDIIQIYLSSMTKNFKGGLSELTLNKKKGIVIKVTRTSVENIFEELRIMKIKQSKGKSINELKKVLKDDFSIAGFGRDLNKIIRPYEA